MFSYLAALGEARVEGVKHRGRRPRRAQTSLAQVQAIIIARALVPWIQRMPRDAARSSRRGNDGNRAHFDPIGAAWLVADPLP